MRNAVSSHCVGLQLARGRCSRKGTQETPTWTDCILENLQRKSANNNKNKNNNDDHDDLLEENKCTYMMIKTGSNGNLFAYTRTCMKKQCIRQYRAWQSQDFRSDAARESQFRETPSYSLIKSEKPLPSPPPRVLRFAVKMINLKTS